MSDAAPSLLRILHAVRAPVGGIIRHIVDLADGQAALGHEVGILADSLTGGARADALFADIAPRMKLGIHRLAIRREPHPLDLIASFQFLSFARSLKLDVLHGHGAKAGAFVRLRRKTPGAIRIYTPHGGSLHYPPDTLKGAFYARLEKALMNRTELFLFESGFARDTYERVIGRPQGLVRCVFNGVTSSEFDPVAVASDATDLVYVGEFRHIKGADLLVEAVGQIRARGRPVTLTLAGDGEETENLHKLIARLNLQDAVRFVGHVKARYGFAQGKLLIVPSRGDSMPYVVIEAAAAGVPMLAARIGGIPEIFGPHDDGLFVANSVGDLARAIENALDDMDTAKARAKVLRERILANFSQKAMVEGVMAGYGDAFSKS